jgi:hypothetical protein
MDPAFHFTVAGLAKDEAVRLPCACRVRTFGRQELMALIGRDARLHLNPAGPHLPLEGGQRLFGFVGADPAQRPT